MTENETVRYSKFMSLVLRHKPDAAGIALDRNGWADVAKLIAGMGRAGHAITMEQLREVVRVNDKQRFTFSADGTKIRASQGHSVPVDVQPSERVPPAILYHGTATRFIESIRRQGLIPAGRLFVHLSSDYETAQKVGARHGKAVVLSIDASRMHENGTRFFLSDNGVWLVAKVPPECISDWSYV